MNSTAAIKAFCGERGGMVCTSSNAKGAFDWAFAAMRKSSSCPISTWAATPASRAAFRWTRWWCGIPYQLQGGQTAERLRKAKVILWKGHCSVHQRFLPEHVDKVRANYPGIQVIVHPECRWEVCQKADGIGSTDYLIKVVKEAPAGSSFAIGTEIHLVNRLAKENPDKRVITLDDSGCLCTTMFRISPQHLCWALENLVDGNVVNQIQGKSRT